MTIGSWPIWVGLFALITVLGIPFMKKTRHRVPPGHKDTSIHEKPLFKAASLCIGVGLIFLILLSTQ